MQTKLDKHTIAGDIMGFLDKIKESVGMNSEKRIDAPALDKDLDLLNTQQAAQENTVQPEMKTQEAPAADIPSNTENIPPNNIDIPSNTEKMPSNDIEGIPLSQEPIQEPSLSPETQPEIKNAEIADIQTPEKSTKNQDIQDIVQDTVPESTPLDNNTAENFENIRQEKMKISGELERLTSEIDGIIKNLENELKDGKTVKKTEAKPENNTKKDRKAPDVPKKEKDIKKADNKADNAASAKQSEVSKKITEKDIEALEDFLSKENIKDIPKSK